MDNDVKEEADSLYADVAPRIWYRLLSNDSFDQRPCNICGWIQEGIWPAGHIGAPDED